MYKKCRSKGNELSHFGLIENIIHWSHQKWPFRKKNWKLIMDGAGANMCKAVNIDGVAVKATFVSRVCVGGKD